MSTAATTSPSRSRTGAATDLSPSSSSWSTITYPVRRTRVTPRFAELRTPVYEQIQSAKRGPVDAG